MDVVREFLAFSSGPPSAFLGRNVQTQSSIASKRRFGPFRPSQRRNASRRLRSEPPSMDVAGSGIYAEATKPEDVRVIVFGATGYIGRVVVSEFVSQGYAVTAFARPRSGVGGKKTAEDVKRDLSPALVVFGDVCNPGSISAAFETADNVSYASTVVVSCLASRSGGVEDSQRIDYGATLNVLQAARAAGAGHFVLLSAICVQNPILEFQRSKLQFESALAAAAMEDSSFSYSVVRPTAFFKSLASQVERMKNGNAYVMFGDGALAKCNALSERDLAKFIVLCAREEKKRNAILPVGGPGEPVTPKEQADMIFKILGRKPKYWSLPIGIMDGVIGVLDSLAGVFPFFKDPAEFGKIGKFYATEDMIGPSFGSDTLQKFFENAVQEGGMADQDLGDANVF